MDLFTQDTLKDWTKRVVSVIRCPKDVNVMKSLFHEKEREMMIKHITEALEDFGYEVIEHKHDEEVFLTVRGSDFYLSAVKTYEVYLFAAVYIFPRKRDEAKKQFLESIDNIS